SVCIKPYAVKMAAELLAGSGVEVGTVIGFPHGSCRTEVKVFESELACKDGATELDMVVNVGKVLSKDWDYVEADVRAVVEVAHKHEAITKVIFENDFLPDDEFKIKLCEICERAGAEFVKTSSGFGFVKQADGNYNYQGATDADLKLMREHCSPAMQVKAAGGVRTYEHAARIRDLGVTRIGATATEAIAQAERDAADG
ncbi:MAG: deoxyribose-phosphate aldolase, partial [Planctomycetales bacterium]